VAGMAAVGTTMVGTTMAGMAAVDGIITTEFGPSDRRYRRLPLSGSALVPEH
jgi:hypothetical protein